MGRGGPIRAAAVTVPLPSPVYKKPTPVSPLKAPPPTRASPPPPSPVRTPRNRQECIPQCLVDAGCIPGRKRNVAFEPPGQYGNKEKCGKCYSDMTTRGGKLKCP